jgi:hypothetical protein
MDTVDDDPHGSVFIMFADTGNRLVKIWIQQTRHGKKKLSFQRSGLIRHHRVLPQIKNMHRQRFANT